MADNSPTIPQEAIEAAAAVIHAAQDIVNSWQSSRKVARAALAAALPMLAGWRPIESAPKDAVILVTGGTIHARDDSLYPYEGPSEGVSTAYWYYDHWRGDNLEGHDNWFEHRPTHWMPLPPPPQGGKP